MKEIRFYKGDQLIVSFAIAGKGETITKDNFVLFMRRTPVLIKDGKRFTKYDRMEVVDDRR